MKHWRHTSIFLKNLITHFALLAHVIVILREDYNTFRYWVTDDNSRHQREKIALIFHKCQLQRRLNNTENIFVDNREPQCKYCKLPHISPSPSTPPTPQLYDHLPVNIKIHRHDKPPPNVWNWIWFIMAFWTLIKDNKCKKYFDYYRYSLSRSAFSIQGLIPHGYKPLGSISSSKTPCEYVYFNLFSGDVHKRW